MLPLHLNELRRLGVSEGFFVCAGSLLDEICELAVWLERERGRDPPSALPGEAPPADILA